MNDRELLEAAAKSAGFEYNGVFFDAQSGLLVWEPPTNYESRDWNPLADDGDALRLSVKLGIHISQQLSYCATFCPHGNNSTRGTTWTEQYNDAPAAATRRAIVRAAAAMGATAGKA